MTRGKAKPIKPITVTGNAYLIYYISGELLEFIDPQYEGMQPLKGDLGLLPVFDEKRVVEYHLSRSGHPGYFKPFIFDGKSWCHVKLDDLFLGKENYFSKKDFPLDVYNNLIVPEVKKLGQEKLVLYEGYRRHYTTHLYTPNAFKGKKGHYNNA